jgi:hypothetical protein
MAVHILQVAYYPTLQETRALVLKSVGYDVALRIRFAARWFFGSKRTTPKFRSRPPVQHR